MCKNFFTVSKFLMFNKCILDYKHRYCIKVTILTFYYTVQIEDNRKLKCN